MVIRIHRLLFTLILLAFSLPTLAAGLLTPKDGGLPALSIKSHDVNVVIEDGYAVTRVEQSFYNPHDRDLEAIYSFPVPEHGSVAEFTMWIDGQPVSGEVLAKKEARRVYEEEKAAGREAGLTEKDEYKTFEVSVWPVRAGQETKVRLVYMQPVDLDTGTGRYVYPLEEGGVDEVKQAFWTANDKVEGHFSFDLIVKSSYPVDAIRVPQHGDAVVTQQGAGEWHVHLGANGTTNTTEGQPAPPTSGAPVFSLDKDILVYWRLAQGLPGSVDLVTYKPDAAGRGTFMMVLTPGDDLATINEGVDWTFVLDISSSMTGKYATLAEGVQKGMDKMRPDDRFRIILFNNSAHELTPGFVPATREAVQEYSQRVAATRPGGGTNLYAGIKTAVDSLDADRTTGIILVTDGVANVGETQQKRFLDLVKTKDVRLFTFIMGNSANRPLLETLTKASNGFALSVSNADDVVGKILLATSKITHQALHGVKLRIKGVKVADQTPEDIGSLYRGQQLVIFGHYWGGGEATVELSGRISGNRKDYTTRFAFPDTAVDNPEIERLWAYAKIRELKSAMDNFGEDADAKQAVTDLGVEYGLVTDYTSMVVMRDERFAQRGIKRDNQARLAVEQQAQANRAAQGVQSRRVDSGQPMFRSSRPALGGGALNIWGLLGLGALAILLRRRR